MKPTKSSVALVCIGWMFLGVAITTRAMNVGFNAQSTVTPMPVVTPTPSPDPVLVGAGDIARCDNPDGAQSSGAESTARLIDAIPGTVFTAGDNVYFEGTAAEFDMCYDPTWGRFKDRTRPAPGNHDYASADAGPYYAYFGENAGEAGKGYYSYDLGEWHIIVLNSNLYAEAGLEQTEWLQADLEANPAFCSLAMWHHPLFSSGLHGNNNYVAPLWQMLYDAGVDMVINGHDHTYERFAPQDVNGEADAQRGIREFVVGTGGAPLYAFLLAQPNSEVRDNSTFGVLKLTLHPTSYDWEFVSVNEAGFTDIGSGECHA